MAFKMNGSPAKMGTISGTAGHASALKQADPYAKALKKDPKLGEYVKTRNSSEKGSAEYDSAQNKINVAYGNKTRHGQTDETTVSKSGKKQTNVKTTPGVATTTTEVKPRILAKGTKTTKKTEFDSGKTAKTVIRKDKDGDNRRANTKVKGAKGGDGSTYDKKIKTKYDKDGVAIKEKRTYKTDQDNDGKVDRKYKTKTNFKKGTKKTVKKEDGRRIVTKTDKEGNVTTKSRRTLKGFLTGKGKKNKEE